MDGIDIINKRSYHSAVSKREVRFPSMLTRVVLCYFFLPSIFMLFLFPSLRRNIQSGSNHVSSA